MINIPYFYTSQSNDSLIIDNEGNTTLLLNNDLGYCWYLDISTNLGTTTVKQLGPINIDTGLMINKNNHQFVYSNYELEYNENKLIKIIDKYINDAKKSVTQIQEIDRQQFLNILVRVLEVKYE